MNPFRTTDQPAAGGGRHTGWRLADRLVSGQSHPSGLTLLELLIAMALVAVLAATGVRSFRDHMERAQRANAVSDIHVLQSKLLQVHGDTGQYPDSLTTISWTERDPWGNPYQYLKIEGADPKDKGKFRKDRFLVPINSTYDLYSMGPDGKSVAPLTANASLDDIIRANDGQYVGLASNY